MEGRTMEAIKEALKDYPKKLERDDYDPQAIRKMKETKSY